MAIRLHWTFRLKGGAVKLRTIGLTLVAAGVVLVPALVVAQQYPHYVNARTYLRTAQMLMRVPERPNVQLTLKPADDELDAVVREMDRAGVVDRKQIVDRPAINEKLEDADRISSIVYLLRAARGEIQQETDNAHAELKSGAVKQISAALESVHKAAIDAHLDRAIGDF
jgi:hypothetical protein